MTAIPNFFNLKNSVCSRSSEKEELDLLVKFDFRLGHAIELGAALYLTHTHTHTM